MSDSHGSGPAQFGFDLGDASAPVSYAPDPGEVRAELLDILAVARAAEGVSPWDERTFAYHRTVFPQMARWLPEDERDQLCHAFAQVTQRIERLLAA